MLGSCRWWGVPAPASTGTPAEPARPDRCCPRGGRDPAHRTDHLPCGKHREKEARAVQQLACTSDSAAASGSHNWHSTPVVSRRASCQQWKLIAIHSHAAAKRDATLPRSFEAQRAGGNHFTRALLEGIVRARKSQRPLALSPAEIPPRRHGRSWCRVE